MTSEPSLNANDIRCRIEQIDRDYAEAFRAESGHIPYPRRGQGKVLPDPDPLESFPDLSRIRTEHVRGRLRGLSWGSRRVIEDLMEIEHLIVFEPRGMAAMVPFSTRARPLYEAYPDDFIAILEELKPDAARSFRDRERRVGELNKVYLKRRQSALRDLEGALRRQWLESGGAA